MKFSRKYYIFDAKPNPLSLMFATKKLKKKIATREKQQIPQTNKGNFSTVIHQKILNHRKHICKVKRHSTPTTT